MFLELITAYPLKNFLGYWEAMLDTGCSILDKKNNYQLISQQSGTWGRATVTYCKIKENGFPPSATIKLGDTSSSTHNSRAVSQSASLQNGSRIEKAS